MLSYPLEKDKGKAFGVFWAIFQFGSFIGAIIALAINLNSGGLSAVSTATYLVNAFSLSLSASYSGRIRRLGLHHYHVHWYGVNVLHPASQRNCTRGRHAREGSGIDICARRASQLHQSGQG